MWTLTNDDSFYDLTFNDVLNWHIGEMTPKTCMLDIFFLQFLCLLSLYIFFIFLILACFTMNNFVKCKYNITATVNGYYSSESVYSYVLI